MIRSKDGGGDDVGLDDETVGWLFTGGVGTLGEVLLQIWSLPIPHAIKES